MPADSAVPLRVLFVCMGNICRSPAAEIVFRKMAADAGRSAEFSIDSAGTIGYHQGAPPDHRMAEVLRKAGYAISGNSRKITAADLTDFDLILTMDDENLANVRALDRKHLHHEKIRPFVDYCRIHQTPQVPDPYYGGPEGFARVLELLEDGCQGILDQTTP